MKVFAPGARAVMATEQSSSMAFLCDNIAINPQCAERVACRVLEWGDASQVASVLAEAITGVDLVLGCEITYDRRLYPALIETLEALLGKTGMALIAHNHESTPASARNLEAFLRMCKDRELEVRTASPAGVDQAFVAASVCILEIRRRQTKE
jgi:predicted nicotinamide N-methyase